MFIQSQLHSVEQIIQRLTSRGLLIKDRDKVEGLLKSIGYYRLLIYMRHFQESASPKNFHPGVDFGCIIELYEFDRALRLLVLDAIERLEVALRSAIVNPLAELYGPHWFLDMSHYASPIDFHAVLGKIIQGAGSKKGLALTHYYEKYSEPGLPPIWLVCENMTFGALSRFFGALKIDRRKKIARYLWAHPEKLLVSWFHSIADLRNICAHQGRLWNNPITTYAPEKHYQYDFINNKSFYSRALVIQVLLKDLELSDLFVSNLKIVFNKFSHVNPEKHLGFPANWEKLPLWT